LVFRDIGTLSSADVIYGPPLDGEKRQSRRPKEANVSRAKVFRIVVLVLRTKRQLGGGSGGGGGDRPTTRARLEARSGVRNTTIRYVLRIDKAKETPHSVKNKQ